MVNLFLTKTIDSKYLIDVIKNNNPKGSKHLFIVPDRIVLSYEMLVLDAIGQEGTMDIEVRSFRTLADAVLKNDVSKTLNQQTETMLVRKIIEEKKGDFEYYKRASQYVGFAKEVLSLIALIRGNGVSVEAIKNLSEKLPDKYKNKVRDILYIYSEYIRLLNNGYSDYMSKLEGLRDRFKDSEYADYNIYISEFNSFSQIELDIINEVVGSTQNVYITLPYSDNDNNYIFPTEVANNITNIANQRGVSIVTKNLYKEEELNPSFAPIYDTLFGFKDDYKYTPTEDIDIQVSKNPEDEIKTLAIQIKELVKAGNRYKDIACVCCDIDNYKATFESVFKKYEIPYFADAKDQLINQNLTKILINALKVKVNRFMQADVFALIKELDAIFTIDEINEFENYCLQYGIEFENKFNQPFICTGDIKKQDRVNKFREKLLDILSPLDFKECIFVKEYIEKIQDFFAKINAEKICNDLAQSQEDMEYNVESSVTKQVLKKINAVLDQFDSMLGNCEMSFTRFYKILESTIASVTITTIPMYIDCVYVGDLDKSRYETKKYLFVVGANESLFPKEVHEKGLLTSQDFEKWNEYGVSIYPTVRDANKEAKLNVMMVLLKPTQKLMVSYPIVDMQGTKLEMSTILKDLLKMEGKEKADNRYIPDDSWTIKQYATYVGSRKNALEVYVELKSRVENNQLTLTDSLKKVMAALYTIANEEMQNETKVKQIISGKHDVDSDVKDFSVLRRNSVSVSMFEKYLSCPFKYCIDYVLNLKEREIAGVKVRDTGTILHACMEEFFAREDYDTLPEDQIRGVVENTIDKTIAKKPEFGYLLNPEYKISLDGLINNAESSISVLREKMKVSEFVPYKMEARFANTKSRDGKEPTYPTYVLHTKNKDLNINGEIDRIDKHVTENGKIDKVMIVDYKSKSSTNFSMQDVVFGNKIQPLLYLSKVSQEEKAEPSAALYMSLSDSVTKAKKEDKMKYTGLLIDNSTTIMQMDKTLVEKPLKASNLFPIKIPKQGEDGLIFGAYAGSEMLSKDEMNKTIDYMLKLLGKVVRDMDAGYIKASPLALGDKPGTQDLPHPCQYCDYKVMCGIQNSYDKVRYINVTKGEEDSIKDKLMKQIEEEKK